MEEEEEEKQNEKRMMKTWIRNKPDGDGYFLLKLENIDMFLTAKDDSSLKIERK